MARSIAPVPSVSVSHAICSPFFVCRTRTVVTTPAIDTTLLWGWPVTFRIICRSSSELAVSGSGRPDDQALLGCLDQFRRQGSYLVDLSHAMDLREEAFNQAEVAASDAHNGAQDGRLGPLIQLEAQTELLRLAVDDVLQLRAAEREVLVDEADARIQLCVARQPLLEAWHADEHQTDGAAIVRVAQLLKPSGFDTVSLVDND